MVNLVCLHQLFRLKIKFVGQKGRSAQRVPAEKPRHYTKVLIRITRQISRSILCVIFPCITMKVYSYMIRALLQLFQRDFSQSHFFYQLVKLPLYVSDMLPQSWYALALICRFM
jgi:hypothetical protein